MRISSKNKFEKPSQSPDSKLNLREMPVLAGKNIRQHDAQKRPQTTEQGNSFAQRVPAQPLSLPKTAKEITVKNQENSQKQGVFQKTKEASIQAESEKSFNEYDSPLMANMSSQSIRIESIINNEADKT